MGKLHLEKLPQAPAPTGSTPGDCHAWIERTNESVAGHAWLLKPVVSSLGRGIRYLQAGASTHAEAKRLCGKQPESRMLAMRYIQPATIGGGHKFDFRSCAPLSPRSPLPVLRPLHHSRPPTQPSIVRTYTPTCPHLATHTSCVSTSL